MINSVASNLASQERYRSQVAQSRNEQQMNALSRSLKASVEIGKVVGADTTVTQKNLQNISGGAQAPAAAQGARVSISAQAVEQLRTERQNAAQRTSGTNAAKESSAATNASATRGAQRQKFESVDEAIAYGAKKALEQYQKNQSSRSVSAAA